MNWQTMHNAPLDSTPVFLWHVSWIDEDFNPSGVIDGYFPEDCNLGWVGATWDACQDCFDTTPWLEPSHWMHKRGPYISVNHPMYRGGLIGIDYAEFERRYLATVLIKPDLGSLVQRMIKLKPIKGENMPNIINKLDLFTTPDDMKEVVATIERMPEDQQIIGLTIMSMTWNYLAEQVNTTKETDIEVLL